MLHTLAFWFFLISNSGICVYFLNTVPSAHCLHHFRFFVTGLYFWHANWLAAVQHEVREMHMLHLDALCLYLRSLFVILHTLYWSSYMLLVWRFLYPSFLEFRFYHITSFMKKKWTLFHVSRRTSEFTVATFGPNTTSSEAHWTFERPDNYTYRQEVGYGGESREGE
jgi:hypothetical protein